MLKCFRWMESNYYFTSQADFHKLHDQDAVLEIINR